MTQETKTPGQLAYERSVDACPLYLTGDPRKEWNQLPSYCQRNWEKDPVAGVDNPELTVVQREIADRYKTGEIDTKGD